MPENPLESDCLGTDDLAWRPKSNPSRSRSVKPTPSVRSEFETSNGPGSLAAWGAAFDRSSERAPTVLLTSKPNISKPSSYAASTAASSAASNSASVSSSTFFGLAKTPSYMMECMDDASEDVGDAIGSSHELESSRAWLCAGVGRSGLPVEAIGVGFVLRGDSGGGTSLGSMGDRSGRYLPFVTALGGWREVGSVGEIIGADSVESWTFVRSGRSGPVYSGYRGRLDDSAVVVRRPGRRFV